MKNVIMSEEILRRLLGEIRVALLTNTRLTKTQVTYILRYRQNYQNYGLPELPDFRSLQGTVNANKRLILIKTLEPFSLTSPRDGLVASEPPIVTVAEADPPPDKPIIIPLQGTKRPQLEDFLAQGQVVALTAYYTQLEKIWNNFGKYRSAPTLERVFGIDWEDLLLVVSFLRRLKVEQALAPLRDLIWRDEEDASYSVEQALKLMPQFLIPVEQVEQAQGLLVTSVQFDAACRHRFWRNLKKLPPYFSRQHSVTWEVVGQFYTFGKVDLDPETGYPIGTFAPDFKGHILARDVMVHRCSIQSRRLNPTNLSNLLTDKKLQASAKRVERSCELVFVGGCSRLELRHRPRIGMYASEHHPRAFYAPGAFTKPIYPQNHLGQPSAQADIGQINHQYAAVAVAFDRAGRPYHYDIAPADPNSGEFYALDLYQFGVLRVTEQGVVRVKSPTQGANPAVAAIICPDQHEGLQLTEIYEAVWQLIDTFRPQEIHHNDGLNGHSVNEFKDDDIEQRVFENTRGMDKLLDELEGYCKRLLQQQQRAPYAVQVIHPANHPKWVQKYLRKGRFLRDAANTRIGLDLLTRMIDFTLQNTGPNPANRAMLDPVHDFASRWLAKHGADMAKFHFVEDQENVVRPINAKRQTMILHGHETDKGHNKSPESQLQNMDIPVTQGHRHSGFILGNDHRGVGTMTPLIQHYSRKKGTNNTHSVGVLFEDGQEMMIHVRQDGSFMPAALPE
jgi:hypothetical protein